MPPSGRCRPYFCGGLVRRFALRLESVLLPVPRIYLICHTPKSDRTVMSITEIFDCGETHLLSGKRFRLRSDILALKTAADGKRVAFIIPGGETFRVLSGPRPDDLRMVDITWKKDAFVIFAEDIELRCDELIAKSVEH